MENRLRRVSPLMGMKAKATSCSGALAGQAGTRTLDAAGANGMGKGSDVRRGSFAMHWHVGEDAHAP